MKLVTRIAIVALGVSPITAALAEEPVARSDGRAVVALVAPQAVANAHAVSALDRYVGRYDAAADAAFIVDREGEELLLELPAALGGTIVALYPDGAPDSFATDSGARIVFRTDAAGRVAGLAWLVDGLDPLNARKAPLPRGIVTVYDLVPVPAEPFAQSR